MKAKISSSEVIKFARQAGLGQELLDKVKKRIAERRLVKSLILYRVEAGLTQGDIAKAMGCTQSRISKLESKTDDDLSIGDIKRYLKACKPKSSHVVRLKSNKEPSKFRLAIIIHL